MQIIKIKIKVFERKMGFSEIKRALKCFTVCCMPCPVRLSEGIKIVFPSNEDSFSEWITFLKDRKTELHDSLYCLLFRLVII